MFGIVRIVAGTREPVPPYDGLTASAPRQTRRIVTCHDGRLYLRKSQALYAMSSRPGISGLIGKGDRARRYPTAVVLERRGPAF